MNPIDLFISNNLEAFAAIACFVPLAVIAWLTRNNHGERVYTLPDTNQERIS